MAILSPRKGDSKAPSNKKCLYCWKLKWTWMKFHFCLHIVSFSQKLDLYHHTQSDATLIVGNNLHCFFKGCVLIRCKLGMDLCSMCIIYLCIMDIYFSWFHIYLMHHSLKFPMHAWSLESPRSKCHLTTFNYSMKVIVPFCACSVCSWIVVIWVCRTVPMILCLHCSFGCSRNESWGKKLLWTPQHQKLLMQMRML